MRFKPAGKAGFFVVIFFNNAETIIQKFYKKR